MNGIVSSLNIPCAICGDGITVPRATLRNAIARELIACQDCLKCPLNSFPDDVQKKIVGILQSVLNKLAYLRGVATSLEDKEFSTLIDDYEARINAGRCWDRF